MARKKPDMSQMRKRHYRISVLSAPSNLGLKPVFLGQQPGVREAPAALLRLDLLQRLRAVDAGMVTPPAYDPEIDPMTGTRNAAAIRSYSIKLANRIGEMLDNSQFPLILGGDCSILLGSALALRRRGRYGLLFIDGHTDLLTPATSTTGGVAGMDLAVATGEGLSELTSIEDLKPYFRPEDVVLYGFRWPGKDTASPAQPLAPMLSFPLSVLREQRFSGTAQQAIEHFAGRPFWVHVDADVLDPRWMPAVDSPDPEGMSPEELSGILEAAVAVKNCVGMELTIYDPTLDPSGDGASLLVNLISDAMAQTVE